MIIHACSAAVRSTQYDYIEFVYLRLHDVSMPSTVRSNACVYHVHVCAAVCRTYVRICLLAHMQKGRRDFQKVVKFFNKPSFNHLCLLLY